MKRFLFKLKKALTLKKIFYFTSLVTFPLAGYLIGKGENLKMENPDIVIDTSQIDCGCGGQTTNGETVEDGKETVKSDSVGKEEDPLVDTNSEGGQFVASENGQKYYPIDCASANRIKEENRVYYGSAAEAEADGKEIIQSMPVEIILYSCIPYWNIFAFY